MTDASQKPIVVLLEDEEIPMHFARKALEKAGYEVVSSDGIADFNKKPETDGSYGINTGVLPTLGLDVVLASRDNLPQDALGEMFADDEKARKNGVSKNPVFALTKNATTSFNPNIAAIVSDQWFGNNQANSLFEALNITCPEATIRAMSVSISSRNGLQNYVYHTANKGQGSVEDWSQYVVACVNDIAERRNMKPSSPPTSAAESGGAGGGTPMSGLRGKHLKEMREI